MKRAAFLSAMATGLILAAAPTSRAHTMSVMLNKTAAEPGGKATVYLSWGHVLPVDELVNGKDLDGYQAHLPSGSVLPLKVDDRSLQSNEVPIEDEGVYQFATTRKPSVFCVVKTADGKMKHLRGSKAEAKLAAGETIVQSARSTMFAKAILTSGAAEGKTAAKLGHALEIVPLTEPSQIQSDAPAKFVVLFRGEPLASASVQATNVANGLASQTLETNADGVVEFTPDEEGCWILGVNHRLKPSGDDAKLFDAESYGATLTIGVVGDEKD